MPPVCATSWQRVTSPSLSPLSGFNLICVTWWWIRRRVLDPQPPQKLSMIRRPSFVLMLATVSDSGPTSKRHWVGVSCLVWCEWSMYYFFIHFYIWISHRMSWAALFHSSNSQKSHFPPQIYEIIELSRNNFCKINYQYFTWNWWLQWCAQSCTL